MSRSDTRSPDGSLSRRGFLRTTAGTAGVAAALYGGNRANLVGSARADNWQLVKDALTATSGYAYAYDYLMGSDYTGEAQTRLANYAHQRFGDMRNYDGYTGASALHQEIVVGATEMKLADEKIMTGIYNQIEASDNVGYSKGKVALIESLNAGNDVTTAKDAMNAALNDYYSSIQKAILQHWKTQMAQVQHMTSRVMLHSNLNLGERDVSDGIFALLTDTGAGGVKYLSLPNNTWGAFFLGAEGTSDDPYSSDWKQLDNIGTASFELLNGNTVDDIPVSFDYANDAAFMPYYTDGSLWSNGSNANTLQNKTDVTLTESSFASGLLVKAPENQFTMEIYGNGLSEPYVTSTEEFWFGFMPFFKAMGTLYSARDRVNADLQGFADDLYAEYQSGDISLAEVVDPITYATEISQENNPDAFREASAAQLGIPSDAAFNTTIEVFTDDGSGNEVSSQFETELFTAHNPTDADGNVVDWQVGTRYSPSNWSDPLFITYPADDSGNRDMTQLEKDFKIVGAIDQDGNAIDSFGSRQTNVQTADITKLQEDLDRLRDTQNELLADQTTSDDGGGGGGSTSDTNPLMQKVYGIPVVGYILGIGGGAYLYSERNSDDDLDHGRRGGGRY